MKRKYHQAKYRPNGSLRVEAPTYGTVRDVSARDLKREAAEELRVCWEDRTRADRRLLRLERSMGPRRTKAAQQAISTKGRAALTKSARRIFDAYAAAEHEYQDAEIYYAAR